MPDEVRILAMGDSVPFGIGSRQEDTYPSQLEALLNQKYPGRRFRTLNMGVPSYNTEQEKIQLLTTGLPLKPDAVIRIPFIREMLEVVARRERFPLVDLQREMDPRWAGQDERLFHNSVTDDHPSPLGNRALAVLMAESMERLKVLGR